MYQQLLFTAPPLDKYKTKLFTESSVIVSNTQTRGEVQDANKISTFLQPSETAWFVGL
jgi:hypothetical protein